MAQKRIGIYGGSFNPPHLGHLRAAHAVRKALGLTEVRLIPAGIPPHKTLPAGTPTAQERLEMTRLLAEGEPGLTVSDLELRREGPCYTADTLAQLRREEPDAALFLVVGTDMLLTLERWYRPEEILNAATVAALPRRKEDLTKVRAHAAFLRRVYGARIQVVDARPMEISSTEVRQLLEQEGAEPFLKENVCDYIRRKGLYGALPWSLSQLRRQVAERVDARRFTHILGCEETAAKLARRYGARELYARAAGILHDVTKCLKEKEQLQLCEKYGIMLDIVEKQNPKLLHAKTGAAVAAAEFKAPEEICSAIRWHTTGRAGMTLLEKIIYLADYIEPGRKFEGVDRLRRLAEEDLDRAVLLGLEMSLSYVKGDASPQSVSPASQEAADWLRGTMKKD